MNEDEKKAALALCEKHLGRKAWCTLYENQITKTSAQNISKESKEMKEYEKDKAKGFPVFLPDYMN